MARWLADRKEVRGNSNEQQGWFEISRKLRRRKQPNGATSTQSNAPPTSFFFLTEPVHNDGFRIAAPVCSLATRTAKRCCKNSLSHAHQEAGLTVRGMLASSENRDLFLQLGATWHGLRIYQIATTLKPNKTGTPLCVDSNRDVPWRLRFFCMAR